ncbi:MAG: hypothetical protein ACMUHU_06445 [Thermoplasmatota archaeon]
MGEGRSQATEGIELVVRKSPISGSGIARVHISIIDLPEFTEGKVALFEKGAHKKVLRLVGDNLMTKGRVSLRKKDMESLRVREGDKVMLSPVVNIGDRIKDRLKIFRTRDDQA